MNANTGASRSVVKNCSPSAKYLFGGCFQLTKLPRKIVKNFPRFYIIDMTDYDVYDELVLDFEHVWIIYVNDKAEAEFYDVLGSYPTKKLQQWMAAPFKKWSVVFPSPLCTSHIYDTLTTEFARHVLNERPRVKTLSTFKNTFTFDCWYGNITFES